jgi:hypothetical protein
MVSRRDHECSQIWRFDYLYDYITAKGPKGCGWEPEVVEALLEKAGDAEALDMFRKEMRGKEGRELDAKTPDLKEPHRPKKPDNKKEDVRVSGYGNDPSYALARLRRDRPDIHARVLAGELSPHAGMVEAGFRKPTVRKKLSRVERTKKVIEAWAKPERRELYQHLDKLRADSHPTRICGAHIRFEKRK